MPSDRLTELRKALSLLEKQVASRKACLEASLAKKETLTSEDEAWLDHDANLVDERYALDVLSCAPNHDAALAELTLEQKEAVARLEKLVESWRTSSRASHARCVWTHRREWLTLPSQTFSVVSRRLFGPFPIAHSLR
ncbi:hypothetical protein L227DRAFT_405175 [Lentinus tigrinus ALCF2SS1-6]|uniref:Uncharacterized protein n=1 Tax=Lentinus tigrinus ALCF2SS1-6 TaxID=1328759 RepID=A0A5C2RNT9_9APHY|nr:hypothetical protein L227DRAFT_405175 [Lentinus tigrinus ALCF2SS1-6]